MAKQRNSGEITEYLKKSLLRDVSKTVVKVEKNDHLRFRASMNEGRMEDPFFPDVTQSQEFYQKKIDKAMEDFTRSTTRRLMSQFRQLKMTRGRNTHSVAILQEDLLRKIRAATKETILNKVSICCRKANILWLDSDFQFTEDGSFFKSDGGHAAECKQILLALVWEILVYWAHQANYWVHAPKSVELI